jgi:Uncharacterized protein conserved in bacteria (DUF2252)
MQGNEIDDLLFLQVKEAQASVLVPYAGASGYANNGQRIVVGQRIIQGAPDIFLGWGEVDGHAFYVRQLRDMKGGADLDRETASLENLPHYGALCGWALAPAHAKSGDPAMLAGYLGKSGVIDEAIARFAYPTPTRPSGTTERLLQRRARAGFRSLPSPDRLGEGVPPHTARWNERSQGHGSCLSQTVERDCWTSV